MISDNQIASEISDRVLEVHRLMHEILLLAYDSGRCSPEDLSALKRAVGGVLAELLLDMVNPLYQAHPELKPDGLQVPNI
jgi:hypothetical protein